ncbi:MAG: hypothetical protein LRY61_08525, partial [Burkholderiaceae bacterium]|nr:hypothetical protein [Burkholderiaceae bacterium]MCD8517292.1 hypothetical protein [Burkholderiaceae bacterium]
MSATTVLIALMDDCEQSYNCICSLTTKQPISVGTWCRETLGDLGDDWVLGLCLVSGGYLEAQ